MQSETAWNEILALYADPEFAQQLLKRQDDEGLDVVLHLFIQCARTHGYELDDVAQQRAAEHVQSWREQVIFPLRALRRSLKNLPEYAGHREAVRSLVKSAELTAERSQVDMLCLWLAADYGRLKTHP